MGQANVLDPSAVRVLKKACDEGRLRSLSSKRIVLTGIMSLSRHDMTELILALGGIVQNQVSLRTTLLVTSDKDSTSTKMNDALMLGVKVVSEEEFVASLVGPHQT